MNISGVDKQSIEEATAEAEAKPLEFDPKERATFLRSMLAAVPPLVARGVPAEEITARYPKLADEYPKLLKMMLAKEDLSPINAMLKALDRMATGSLTQQGLYPSWPDSCRHFREAAIKRTRWGYTGALKALHQS